MYEVLLLPKAEKYFARADASLAKRLANCFEILETNPSRHPNVKKLTGLLRGFYRFRAGDYRVIYKIDVAAKAVFVVRIAHRREAYE